MEQKNIHHNCKSIKKEQRINVKLTNYKDSFELAHYQYRIIVVLTDWVETDKIERSITKYSTMVLRFRDINKTNAALTFLFDK